MYFNIKGKDVAIKSSFKEYNLELEENEHMHIEEDSTGDKIPVPNGYVGSKVAGENEIDTGYVIYEGEGEVNDENVEEAQKTRNQYVWIPVLDVSTMYGIDENGKKWGKTYSFAVSSNYDESTGAIPLNWSENNGIMKIEDKTGYREPDIVTNNENTKYDMDSKLKNLEIGEETTHEFLIELERDFNNMLESVEKYGGFYIGRYETGNLSKENLVIQKGNTNLTGQTWYKIYTKCKNLANENVETNIIWTNQWDRTLMWLIESRDKTKEQICVDSTSWGNFGNAEFKYINNNGIEVTKNKGEINTRIPTGNAEYTKANNIYDLAGNAPEWVMGAYSQYNRIFRGGAYYEATDSVSIYIYNNPNVIAYGFRVTLYIK